MSLTCKKEELGRDDGQQIINGLVYWNDNTPVYLETEDEIKSILEKQSVLLSLHKLTLKHDSFYDSSIQYMLADGIVYWKRNCSQVYNETEDEWKKVIEKEKTK